MADAMRVLIVGAGLAGVSLAISLRERGVSPDVIERLPAWPTHGAGIYLVGNAMRALQALGVAEDVHRQGAEIRRQVLMDHRGRKLVEIDTERVWGSCGPCVGVRRAVLQQELVNALGESEVQFSTTVTSIEKQGDGAVVGFSDGTERNYELVVGACTLLFGNVCFPNRWHATADKLVGGSSYRARLQLTVGRCSAGPRGSFYSYLSAVVKRTAMLMQCSPNPLRTRWKAGLNV